LPLSDFLFANFSHPEYDWNIACWTLSNQSINQSIRTHYCIQLYWCVDIALLKTGTCFSVSSDDKLVLFVFPGIPTGDPALVAFYDKRI
jgi:hypothetical protein